MVEMWVHNMICQFCASLWLIRLHWALNRLWFKLCFAGTYCHLQCLIFLGYWSENVAFAVITGNTARIWNRVLVPSQNALQQFKHRCLTCTGWSCWCRCVASASVSDINLYPWWHVSLLWCFAAQLSLPPHGRARCSSVCQYLSAASPPTTTLG